MEMPAVVALVVVREDVAARVGGAVEERKVLERAERAGRWGAFEPQQHRAVAVDAIESALVCRPPLTVVPSEHDAGVVDDFAAAHLEARHRADAQRRLLGGVSEHEVEHDKAAKHRPCHWGSSRQTCSAYATRTSQKSASTWPPVAAALRCILRCCQSATAIDTTDAASSTPEIGRVTNSHGSESVMIERTRLISIWSPRITPRMKGASGKPNFTMR